VKTYFVQIRRANGTWHLSVTWRDDQGRTGTVENRRTEITYFRPTDAAHALTVILDELDP
jgi:hypothetical protein